MQRNAGRQRQNGGGEGYRPIIEPVAAGDTEMSLADIFGLVLRHWLVVVAIVGGVVGAAFFYVTTATPLYTARGEVYVARPTIQTGGNNSLVQTQTADIGEVPNEAALLRSRTVAAGVIRELSLAEDPEFAIEGADSDAPPIDLLIDDFQDRLSVTANPDTRLIEVSFESEDPERAAGIVNTLMRVYVETQIDSQRSAAEQATRQLQGTVEELEAEAQAAEDAVKRFRREAGLLNANTNTDITAEKVGVLNAQLIQAQSDLVTLRAELQQLENARRRGEGVLSAPRVVNSPLIQRLREREADLIRQRAALSRQYGEKHPDMIAVRESLEDVRANINDEVRKIVTALRSEVAAGETRVDNLRENVEVLEREAVSTRGAEAELGRLVQNAQERRTILQNYRLTLRQTQAQRQLLEPTSRIHSEAQVPTKPSFPQKGKILGIAGFLGLVFAAVMVMILGSLRRTIETPEEIERMTGYRALGIVPRISGVSGGKRTATRITQAFTKKDTATFGHALKGIRSTLFLAAGSRAPRSILVTSATPNEGKTTFAISYAMMCAAQNENVILIDCDLGRPDLHVKMGVSNDVGLANYLNGEVDWENVIRKDPRTGMDYVTAGALQAMSVTEINRSNALKSFLDELSWRYDTIVIDSAPVLAMSDSQLLSKMVDATVFVVRWRETKAESIAAAVNRLDDLGANNVAGFVMSNVVVPRSKGAAVSGYYAAYHR